MAELTLASEYLAATSGARVDLVLLHGWGCNREIWRPLLASLRPWANITLVDLPSCSLEPSDRGELTLDRLLPAILACAPRRACYLGWSLGGALASEMAARYLDRVSALLTICSNPSFLADGDWPGMDADEFGQFYQQVASDPQKALQRFDSLQTTGSNGPDPRGLQRQLVRLRTPGHYSYLLAELSLLREIDTRGVLPNLEQRQLHLLSETDALVPPALAATLEQLLRANPHARVASLGRVSHVAPLEIAEELAAKIEYFLDAGGLLHAPRVVPPGIAKAEVGLSFSAAAQAYDSVAALQREVGDRLLESIPVNGQKPKVVLDLGCGTGHFYRQLTRLGPAVRYIGLDLAPGMVEYARSRYGGNGLWLVGDAEHMPVAANSVDLVFSSLAIQWCSDPHAVFAELARVLRPGGQCVFTSLGPETLRELRDSWAAVDSYQHVNSFIPASKLERAATDTPGIKLTLRTENFLMQYQRVGELLRELKVLGAHNMTRGRPPGLTGKTALQGMFAAYEGWRDGGMLPATYDVQFGIVDKDGRAHG